MLGAAVGALIISRYPRNMVGWLFAAGQLGDAFGLACKAVVFTLITTGPLDAIPRGVLFGSQLFGAFFTVAFLALIYLLAPEGRLPVRRWRYAPLVPIGALLAQDVVLLTFPPSWAGQQDGSVAVVDHQQRRDGGGDRRAVAVWRRLQVATGERRQRFLSWLAASGAALTATYALLVAVQRGCRALSVRIYLATSCPSASVSPSCGTAGCTTSTSLSRPSCWPCSASSSPPGTSRSS